jgi:hypothetical protein
MPSIEEAIRFHRQRAQVLYNLADTHASLAACHRDREDEDFWSGVTSILDDLIGLLQRLKDVFPPDLMNRDMPTEQDFEEGTK